MSMTGCCTNSGEECQLGELLALARSKGLPSHVIFPSRRRLEVDVPMYRQIVCVHLNTVLRGDYGYLDPDTGLLVFTATEALSRGYCCHSGCRHCPFVGGSRIDIEVEQP